MTEGEHTQPFEEAARAFSVKREDTTPNPPFADDRSIFEEEAPSSEQRRLTYDFYNGITSLVNTSESPFYPSPLELVELHQLHLEAVRASTRQNEIVPEYTLTHVIGASKRLLAYAETNLHTNEAQEKESELIHKPLQILLARAAHLEAIDYPLVTKQEAVAIQQNLWGEARTFLIATNPHYTPDMIGSRNIYSGVQYFPEEHQIEARRRMAFSAVAHTRDDLQRVREQSTEGDVKRYGVKEALVSVTKFGHDDIEQYDLVNVLGAAKREIIRYDVQSNWEDYVRDTVTAYKLLAQGIANRQS